MITLDVADIIVIAGRILGIDSETALGQTDIAAAQAALSEASLAGSVIVDQDTAAAAGIRLMHALLRHRPFCVHGEQIAVAAALQFLSLNGWQADFDSPAAAAVVVEALACGQLSPVSAAEWLSPRLVLDSGRKPPSVVYPQVLLFVQAVFWALGSIGGLFVYVTALADGRAGMVTAPLAPAWVAITGGLAAAELMLGLRLDRVRSKRTWWAVIATEIAMTCFGVLWLAIPAYAFTMLGMSGAALSLTAVLCMIRPRARQYFTRLDDVPGTPDPDVLSDMAGFWRLTLRSPHPAAAFSPGGGCD